MSDIIEHFALDQKGAEDFTFTHTITQDVSGVIKDNARQAEEGNGFWQNRGGRKVASIPEVEVRNAIAAGYQLDTADPVLLKIELYRYLREKGQAMGYQTVRHISTPGATANIIVK